MPRVEFAGPDLTEAINAAAGALSLPPEQVKFTVISMGTKGFLGLGRRPAKISVDPDDPRLDLAADDGPAEKAAAERPRRPEGQKKDTPEKEKNRAKGREPERRAGREKPASPPAAAQPPAAQFSAAQSPAGAPPMPKPAPAGAPPMARPAPAGAEKKLPAAPAALPLTWNHLPPPPTRPGPGETLEAPDQLAQTAAAVAGEILQRMGLSARVTAGRLGSRSLVSLDSDEDNALLIGARGATLKALQLLTAKIAARRLAGGGEDGERRLVLDVADYQARRFDSLLETLKTLAEEVRQTQKPRPLTGLSAAERRLIHEALRPFKDLAAQPGGRPDSLTITLQAAGRRHRRRPG